MPVRLVDRVDDGSGAGRELADQIGATEDLIGHCCGSGRLPESCRTACARIIRRGKSSAHSCGGT